MDDIGQAAKPPTHPRYDFIDLLRGWALVVMIETHVVNAYLPQVSRHTDFYYWLSFVNGLVAPAFLFAAGFSMLIQATRQWDGWLRLGPPLWRQLRRLGFISLVAYYTHLSPLKWSEYVENPDLWRGALQVDILQCIVASLLAVHVLIQVLRNRTGVLVGALLLALAAALITPWVWDVNTPGRLPLAIALFLSPQGISLFPLFPWIVFVLSGAAASSLFLKYDSAGLGARFMNYSLAAGIVMIVVGLSARFVPISLPGVRDFYMTSPLYVLIRLGCVLIFSTLLYYKGGGKYFSSVRRAGQESLLVYGVHLWLIFAVFRGKHIGPFLGLEAGYAACIALSLLVTILMLWLAGRWHEFKKQYAYGVRLGQALIVMSVAIVFLSR